VAAKDLARNALIVVQGHDHPLLRREALHAEQAHWISGEAPAATREYGAKTRYRQPDARCRLASVSASAFDLEFAEPQWAPTPGQYAVVYDGDVCLGGGVIC